MIRKIAFAALLYLPLTCLSAYAAPKIDGWTFLTSSDGAFHYAKNGSAYIHQGVRYLLIEQLPTSNTPDRTIYYFRIGISDVDCRNGFGSIMYYSIQGQYLQRIDYIRGGSSVGTYIADQLCTVDNLQVK